MLHITGANMHLKGNTMRILQHIAFWAIVIIGALLWAPINDGVHPISQNATFLAGEGCTINYEDGGRAINVVDLSDSDEFEEKILAVNVTRDPGQMRIELEACQRFDKIWKENPPSNEKTTHSHFVTIHGKDIQKTEHECDGHYNFVTVHGEAQ